MIAISALILMSFLLLNGCSSVAAKRSIDQKSNSSIDQESDSSAIISHAKVRENNDVERLARLWQKRRQKNFTGDYPVGPGDVLEISVPGLEELKQFAVRITGESTISLPYVGIIKVAGMSEKGLREEIRKRLQKDIMHDPQVTLFAKESPSRQVAVIGAVQKPGLYKLASSSDTVLEMISHAGGMRTDAAERIMFIPAEPAEPDKAKEIIAAMPAQLVSQDPSPLILKDVDPIVINLQTIIRGGSDRYLAIPARPGDVIMVPGSGEVLIQGWITQPGSYKITPGLTLLGAVAAAGGPLFPADSGSVELIRTNKDGQRISVVVDLNAIRRGEEPDIRVREGDVIDMTASGPKVVAYGLYRFFTSIMDVGVGANVAVPIR
ncbi:MAG: polysaccharide biosynthesis/export family protein [Candidatus Binatia bacterium]